MYQILIKALMAILVRLVTAKFLSTVIVHSLNYLAKKSENKLDDEIVKSVAEALEIKL